MLNMFFKQIMRINCKRELWTCKYWLLTLQGQLVWVQSYRECCKIRSLLSFFFCEAETINGADGMII